jgi:hypothetical protein
MKEIQFTTFYYVLRIILFYFGSRSGMMNSSKKVGSDPESLFRIFPAHKVANTLPLPGCKILQYRCLGHSLIFSEKNARYKDFWLLVHREYFPQPHGEYFPIISKMCGSPAYFNRDFMETLNTLKYANRARNIKNKEQTMKFFVDYFKELCHELNVFLRFSNQSSAYRYFVSELRGFNIFLAALWII